MYRLCFLWSCNDLVSFLELVIITEIDEILGCNVTIAFLIWLPVLYYPHFDLFWTFGLSWNFDIIWIILGTGHFNQGIHKTGAACSTCHNRLQKMQSFQCRRGERKPLIDQVIILKWGLIMTKCSREKQVNQDIIYATYCYHW